VIEIFYNFKLSLLQDPFHFNLIHETLFTIEPTYCHYCKLISYQKI